MQTAPAIDIRPPVAPLEKTPLLLETLLRDLTPGPLTWKAAPDRWSISEGLAHLADIEQVYAERVRRIMAESSPAKGVTASAGTRTAVHSELGTSTLAQLLLHEWAGHDLGPLRQTELYRAHAFCAHAGPFQKCWSPKP
jgi:hypothetical protein